MNLEKIISYLESPISEDEFFKIVELADEHFSLKSIILIPSKRFTEAKIKESICKGEKVKVKEIIDEKFRSPSILLEKGLKFIKRYINLLTLLRETVTLSYEQKDFTLRKYKLNFEALSKTNRTNNLFFFSASNVFYASTTSGKYSISFEDVSFDEALKDEIKEFFNIRKDLFEELIRQTELHHNLLVLSKIEQPVFHLKNKQDSYLITEFAMGLVLGGFVEIAHHTPEFNLLHSKLRALFGISENNRKQGYYIDKVIDRANPSMYLQKMVANINSYKQQLDKMKTYKGPKK